MRYSPSILNLRSAGIALLLATALLMPSGAKALEAPTSCTSSSECGAGEVCHDSVCKISCQVGAQGACLAGSTCRAVSAGSQVGTCVISVEAQDFETEDDAYAGPAPKTILVNPLNAGSIPELLAVILEAVVQLGSMAIVLMLIWVGFLFVKAQGNTTELQNARRALMWTVIGGLLLLGASGIGLILRETIESL